MITYRAYFDDNILIIIKNVNLTFLLQRAKLCMITVKEVYLKNTVIVFGL